VKKDVTKIKNNNYVERIYERRLTKEIYEADLDGNAVSGRPRRTFLMKLSIF
jgi:hypothetical protein